MGAQIIFQVLPYSPASLCAQYVCPIIPCLPQVAREMAEGGLENMVKSHEKRMGCSDIETPSKYVCVSTTGFAGGAPEEEDSGECNSVAGMGCLYLWRSDVWIMFRAAVIAESPAVNACSAAAAPCCQEEPGVLLAWSMLSSSCALLLCHSRTLLQQPAKG